jgi:hypothetical protein
MSEMSKPLPTMREFVKRAVLARGTTPGAPERGEA